MDLAHARITANAVLTVASARVIDTVQLADETQTIDEEQTAKSNAHPVGELVAALCSPAGRAITGQLLGVRGRDVFLFSQPRPVAHLDAATPVTLAENLHAKLGDKFADLAGEVETSDTEPLM